MQKDKAYYKHLLLQYSEKKLSMDQVGELLDFVEKQPEAYDQLINSSDIQDLLQQQAYNITIDVPQQASERMREKLLAVIEEKPVVTPPTAHRIHFLRRWYWAAASVLLLLAAGAYLYIRSVKPDNTIAVTNVKNTKVTIEPGKTGAILTLADGRQVVLDSLQNGLVTDQTGARVMLKDGQLAYDPTGETSGAITHNTMTTPNGRQFQLLLPDGTKAWLNAASSIIYPTVFNGRDRSVKITGEVYFEVAKDKQKPFLVNINDVAAVEVLGTHFNVNAYTGEAAIKTTLLEGSVKIKKGIAMETLQPGQQAVVSDGIKKLTQVDTDQVMAWKNGIFNLNGLGLAELMRQLSRWYDVKVVYTSQVPDVELYGKMGRDLNLSQVLQSLQEMDVHCRLEGKKLVVD